jgi:hypothetical protein
MIRTFNLWSFGITVDEHTDLVVLWLSTAFSQFQNISSSLLLVPFLFDSMMKAFNI